MDKKEWKQKYDTLGSNATWGDAERLVKELSTEQLREFIEAHQAVKAYTGLDMRQVFMLAEARCALQEETGEDPDA